MTRFNQSTMLAAVVATGFLSTMLVYADDPPDDVVRAATGRANTETPSEKPAPKPAETETTPQPLLLDTGDEAESRLNRAAVRYENLAKKWPNGLKDWQDRARETLRRIDELLADPKLGIQEQLEASKASSGSGNISRRAVTPIPTTVAESQPEELPLGVSKGTAPAILPVSDEQPADQGGDAGGTAKPIEQAPKASVDAEPLKKTQCHDTGLARRCEELANELRRMAATLRKTVELKK